MGMETSGDRGSADLDRAGQAEIEGRTGGDEAAGGAPAGPHASPRLTNPDATPGAGSLPPAGAEDGEADAATG